MMSLCVDWNGSCWLVENAAAIISIIEIQIVSRNKNKANNDTAV